MTASDPRSIAPIFIGGTGRSGTSIMGHMLAAHPDVFYYSEPRLIIDPGGLQDLIHGRISQQQFRENLLRRFLPLIRKSCHRMPGSHDGAFSETRVLDAFDRAYASDADRNRAAAKFIADLFGIGVATAGRRRWAHKTPHTIVIADRLFQMFPQLVYIHMLRDPRDVAASTIEQKWGPCDVDAFNVYWNDLLTRAERAREAVPPERYVVVEFERLTQDPLDCVRRILRVCDLSADAEKVRQIARTFEFARANVGRFQRSLRPAEERAVLDACAESFQRWQARASAWLDRPADDCTRRGVDTVTAAAVYNRVAP